jgi:hypothetical protein
MAVVGKCKILYIGCVLRYTNTKRIWRHSSNLRRNISGFPPYIFSDTSEHLSKNTDVSKLGKIHDPILHIYIYRRY